MTMTRRNRIALAYAAGLVAGLIVYVNLAHQGVLAWDFTWAWRGARELLAGSNPYRDPSLGFGHPFPSDAPLYYPLPAVFLATPVSWLAAPLAGALFMGISVGALTFMLAGERPERLLILASAPLFVSLNSVQWAPLLLALALVPQLGAIGPLLKPNLGIPLMTLRANRRSLIPAFGLFAVSLVVLPSWPLEWLHNLGANHNTIPLLVWPVGPLLLLALVGWRQRNARLLLLMALMPQRMIWYDQLPLLVIPRGWRQMAGVVILTWVGYIGWRWTGGVESLHVVDDIVAPWTIASLYLPALGLILWQSMPVPFALRLRHRPHPD